MVRERYLGVVEGQNVENVRSGAFCILRIISLPAGGVSIVTNKRSEEAIAVSAKMGINYARKEYEGEPDNGWPVNVQTQICPCDYCFAFGACVHLLFALRVTAHVDSSGREVLINRRKRKRGEVSVLPDLGRPRTIGAALSFERFCLHGSPRRCCYMARITLFRSSFQYTSEQMTDRKSVV